MAGLLIKARGDGAGLRLQGAGLAAGGLAKILDVPAQPAFDQGLAQDQGASWGRLEVDAKDAAALWSQAHALRQANEILLVEPDVSQQWAMDATSGQALAAAAPPCAFEDQSGAGGKATFPGRLAWNLGRDFSDLKSAREAVSAERQEEVFVAHLDTGYDPAHRTTPKNLRPDLFGNFVDTAAVSAKDETPPGQFLGNLGHGTSTLALLAGNLIDDHFDHWQGFDDYLGGAPFASIIPVRIADSVVRFTTTSMVLGIKHALEKNAHVLSMSMGGVASDMLADAVNLAYDRGLIMVAAAGNNFADLPSPNSVVFPARFNRVLAACGVMADGRPYYDLAPGTMQGNWGPASKMTSALGGYTPNVPWARIGCSSIVNMSGGGTSAATPQIAAAAALYVGAYLDELRAYSQPWMRVEAVRNALFRAAAKTTSKMDAVETAQRIGCGVLKAEAALAIKPPAEGDLIRQRPDSAAWSWLKLITGIGFNTTGDNPQTRMIWLEVTQLAQRVKAVDAAVPDTGVDEIAPDAARRYMRAVLDSGLASAPTQRFAAQFLGISPPVSGVTLAGAPGVAGPAKARGMKRAPAKRALPPRRLRVYALDPSLCGRLDTFKLTTATLNVPWEPDLKPGPVGAQIEVVDVDPSSDRIYPPVDLNDPLILAEGGLPPSEGDPKFHQQMVYAVAMTTIGHFEKALGRRALWAPRDARDGERDLEHRRLRLYPHALRTNNAYYSPEKKAILFGYFPAGPTAGDTTPPNSIIFSCLSSDIIAHETCHALLDGLHRRYQEPSNPDVLAFHEAFADVVAIFQHFTMRELVRADVAQARGDLSAAKLLGGLARQFGEGAGYRGPLRNYVEEAKKQGAEDRLDYSNATEAHERGSVLVYAIYEAFLAVVEARGRDLIRLASGGTGILPDGAIHPDLVDRLTDEACKVARHFLQIFIRALDYCPPVDITFGDYLRGVITADRDLVDDDRYGYRVAIIQAFRKFKIMPRDVRTFSEAALLWGAPSGDTSWAPDLLKGLEIGWGRHLPLEQLYPLNNRNKRIFWQNLSALLERDPGLCEMFGLANDLPRYDDDGAPSRRRRYGATNFEVHSIRPAQRVSPDGTPHTDIVAVVTQRRPVFNNGAFAFWFRGGSTLIFDGTHGSESLRYCIVKRMSSASRLERQTSMRSGGAGGDGLRALYFATGSMEPFAMAHAHDQGL